MRELRLRVSADGVEEVLDAVLPALPGGAHVREDGDAVELQIAATPGTPDEQELRGLADPYVLDLSSAEVSDDWRERRLSRYEPLVIGERFLVRPDWAPANDDPALIEIVLAQKAAFGTGLHPTTQTCLAVLGDLSPGGPFVDYGCGSGVLSIAAAKLGWSPVTAVDIDPLSIEATRGNAERNGVDVDVVQADVTGEAPASSGTVVANVPPDIHVALAGTLVDAPALALISGFQAPERDSVVSAWGAHGLRVVAELSAHEWLLLVMR